MASASDLGKCEGWRVGINARPQARPRWGGQVGLPPALGPVLIHHAVYGPVSRAAGPLRRPQEARGQHEGWQAEQLPPPRTWEAHFSDELVSQGPRCQPLPHHLSRLLPGAGGQLTAPCWLSPHSSAHPSRPLPGALLTPGWRGKGGKGGGVGLIRSAPPFPLPEPDRPKLLPSPLLSHSCGWCWEGHSWGWALGLSEDSALYPSTRGEANGSKYPLCWIHDGDNCPETPRPTPHRRREGHQAEGSAALPPRKQGESL